MSSMPETITETSLFSAITIHSLHKRPKFKLGITSKADTYDFTAGDCGR